jgi:hypothetical protein
MKRLLLLTLLICFSVFRGSAQPGLPTVTVRFNNPVYDCPNQVYCVDVEFLSDVPGLQVFGVNVRFFYDDNVLEYMSMGSFEPGYASANPAQVLFGGPGSGDPYGMANPLDWVNGSVEKIGASPVVLSNTEWKRIFSICFHVDDPNFVGLESFCPSLIWDLEADPLMGGYLPGDDGVVITVVDSGGEQDSSPTLPGVNQYNWVYEFDSPLYGHPVENICIPTVCGTVIPVSDWSLYLGIGLMLVVTVFIHRRRSS